MASPTVHAIPKIEQTTTEEVAIEPVERRETVLRVIRSARRRLLVSLFRCDDLFVIDELAAACRRGVRVRVLFTPKAKGWKKRLNHLEAFLKSVGAEVIRYPLAEVKYHAKYIVADDGPALVASLNFTRKCFERTCDFVVLTQAPDVVADLTRVFDTDCAGQPASGLGDRLVVGPEHSRARVAELLAFARHSIRIVDHRVSDPAIVSLLKARRAEGLTVEILGRGDIDGLKSHGKLMLIDGETAVVGSMALSTASLDQRRELAIVVRDPACVRQLTMLFDSMAAQTVSGIEELRG